MARGRPPSPHAINCLKGDPGKRARYQVEPQAVGLPKAPAYLDPVAAAEWADMVPLLSAMGVLGAIDAKALASYCECHSRYRQASDHVAINGMVTDKGRLSPYVKVIETCQNQLYRWLVEFGCTPAARARMRVTPKDTPKADKWAGLLSA